MRPVPRPLLILGCVVLLVLVTVAIRTLAEPPAGPAPGRHRGTHRGHPRVEEGKFDKANQILSAAREAVDSLGGAVEDADEIRHAADEAAIFVNLLSDPLETPARGGVPDQPQAWASRFDSLYKGRSVIIDATITATPETASTHRYEIDYLVLTPGRRDQGAAPRPDRPDRLRGGHAWPGERWGDHVLFGARLAAFEYDLNAGEWLIRFEPKSGVSITHMKALETLGWPSGSWMPDESGARSRGGTMRTALDRHPIARLLHPLLMAGAAGSGAQAEPVAGRRLRARPAGRPRGQGGRRGRPDPLLPVPSRPGIRRALPEADQRGLPAPAALRPKGSPSPMPVVVQGRLGRDGGQLVCDVTSAEALARATSSGWIRPSRNWGPRTSRAASPGPTGPSDAGKAFKDRPSFKERGRSRPRPCGSKPSRPGATVGRPEGMAGAGRGRRVAGRSPSRIPRRWPTRRSGPSWRPPRRAPRLQEAPRGHRAVLSRGRRRSGLRPHRPGDDGNRRTPTIPGTSYRVGAGGHPPGTRPAALGRRP